MDTSRVNIGYDSPNLIGSLIILKSAFSYKIVFNLRNKQQMINARKEDNKVLDDLLGWLQSMGYSLEIVPTEDFRVHTYVIMNLETRGQFSFRMMEIDAIGINKNLYTIFAAMDGLSVNQIYNGLIQMNTCDLAASIYSRFGISLAEQIQKEIGYER